MPNPSDEIKAKLDIVEVVREYIPLKAAGLNFRANCPFHREKTPSFMVSPEKQIWHCFGCGKGGDVFSFVMEIEGLSFVEALRSLAKKAGVVLKRADPVLASKRNVLLDIVELSAKFYHKVLLASPAAEAARAYLKKRALTEATIEAWQIGYSPDSWDSLNNFLKNKGFSENEIFLAGLAVKKDSSTGSTGSPQAGLGRAGFYDRFRGRIMFPISDLSGNAVGFTARVSPAFAEASAGKPENINKKMGLAAEALAKAAKYINSPATMIYEKSKILFGLDKAKMSIKAEDAAILVEGQMDAITARQNGFLNVIASSGTALTAEQVNLIKRYTNNLFLSFDADAAGDLAAKRGIDQAMRAEMQIKVIEVIDAKDPDEIIRKNPDGWRQAVAAAKPVMRYYFDKTFARFNKNDYEGQRQSVNILLPVISKFGSKIEQDFWLKKLSQEIDTQENLLREKLNQILRQAEKKQKLPAYGSSFAKTSTDAKVLADKSADKKAAAGGPASPRLAGQSEPNLGGSAASTKLADSTGAELSDVKQSREAKLSELLLALALKYPSHLEYIVNHLAPEYLVGPAGSPPSGALAGKSAGSPPSGDDYKLFYKNLIIYYNKLIDFWTHEGGNFDLAINYQDLKAWFNNLENLEPNDSHEADYQADNYKCASLLDKLVLLADKDFYDYTAERAKAEIINLVAVLKVNYLSQRRRQIIKLIAATEKENLPAAEKTEKLKELMEEFKALTEEINLVEIK